MASKGELNKSKIIATAAELFYHKGFGNTSFKDIATKSGVPKGNFYYYFKTKDELLEAVLDFHIKNMQDYISGWDEQRREPHQRLKLIAQMTLDNIDDAVNYGCPIGGLSVELARMKDERADLARVGFDMLIDWYEQRFSEVGKDNGRELAMHLLSAAHGAVMLGNVYQSRSHIENEVERLSQWLEQQL